MITVQRKINTLQVLVHKLLFFYLGHCEIKTAKLDRGNNNNMHISRYTVKHFKIYNYEKKV